MAPQIGYATFRSEAVMNYLLVPLMVRFERPVSRSGLLSWYAAVGPFAGFLLNAHQYTSGKSNVYADETRTFLVANDVSFDATTDIKGDLHKLNAGFEGFLGIRYRLHSPLSLFLEAGGNYGLIAIQKDTVNGKNRTGSALLTMGLAIALGH